MTHLRSTQFAASVALLLTLVLPQVTNAQSSDWAWQNPLPQGNDLNAVQFVNTQAGRIVGDAGTVLHTTDGGSSWTSQVSDSQVDLLDVSFIDDLHGWAAGGSPGTIVATTDGGSTWATQKDNVIDPLRVIHFVSNQLGWAVGPKMLVRTVDGGTTWTEISPGDVTNTSFYDVFFANGLDGWIVGDSLGSQPLVLRTSDGGTSWSSQSTGLDAASGRGLRSVYFADAQVGWAVGRQGTILHTSDVGTSWSSQDSGFLGLLTSVHFTDGERGWASSTGPKPGEGKAVLATVDGGVTWTQQGTGAEFDLFSIQFVDASNGWSVGAFGGMFNSEDGGASWTLRTRGNADTYWDIKFASADLGFAVGPSDYAYYTTDSGASWHQSAFGVGKTANTDQFYHLVYLSLGSSGSDTGLAVACLTGLHFRNGVLKTNGTPAWTHRPIGTTKDIYNGVFVDSLSGWLVGANGTIVHTKDSAVSWTVQNSTVTTRLLGIEFIDAVKGWVVGASGTILHTTDAGTTWTQQTSGTSQDLRGLQFIDHEAGWVTGNNRTLLHTTDGGETWTARNPTGSFFAGYDIDFIDQDRGWLVGDNGTILRTIDGGANWTYQDSFTNNALLSVDFVNDSTGWGSGAGGTILRYIGAGGTGTHVKTNQAPASGLRITDSYPNPASGPVTIGYALDQPGHLRIDVFDAPGRRTASLVNHFQVDGTHTATWRADGVANGLYVVRATYTKGVSVARIVVRR